MGGTLLLVILFAGAGLGLWLFQRRRSRLLAAAGSLDQAAAALGGQVQRSRRDPGRGAVLFDESGQRFRLYREHRAQPGEEQALCVVEAETALYHGPDLILAGGSGASHLVTAARTVWPLPWPDLEERATALAHDDPMPSLAPILDDEEARRLVRYALDHRGARLRLSARGCWFECDGFADNGELVAATARTAARALARLLELPGGKTLPARGKP
ncbi:MAG: hypothetical protein ABIJ09_06940 [Pseudomonadota bacterium]